MYDLSSLGKTLQEDGGKFQISYRHPEAPTTGTSHASGCTDAHPHAHVESVEIVDSKSPVLHGHGSREYAALDAVSM